MGTGCYCYKQEKILKNNIYPISRKTIKIIDNQLEKYLCKIYNSKENNGSGFLCKIPFPDELNLLPVLITNNHVLNEEELTKNKYIEISFNDGNIIKKIDLFPERKIYTSINYDTSIIEIFPEKDGIKYFLDVEINSEQSYKKEQIYILQYPNGINCSVSYGYINDINYFNIKYTCCTEYGSSGGPIILLNTFKVIGVHKRSSNFEFNYGTLLQYPILDFNKNKNKNKNKTNRKFLIPVLGYREAGKTTLIESILKIESLKEHNPLDEKMYENEKVIPNLSFLEFDFYYDNTYEGYIDNICNFIKNKFNTNKPENYIDCFWYCICGCKIEQVNFEIIKLLRNKFREIPLILIYTKAFDKNIKEMIFKYVKSKINIDFYPVLAKKFELTNGMILQPYGIDILLKETITKCENRRKNRKIFK